MSGTTPEGRVKKAVKKVLDGRGKQIYRFMPVPTGFGSTTLDFLGCYAGIFFAIETKKLGALPTLRQQQVINDIRTAGGKVFVIDGDTTELEKWLNDPHQQRR